MPIDWNAINIRCEWDPERDAPATVSEITYHGCMNDAVVSVGAKGEFYLCESCAALPRFSRYRVRKPIHRKGRQ